MKFKQSCKFIKHAAFTLAEVLIVLGIIGIIAELTIPTLVSNFQKQANLVKLKETYAILNSALVRAGVDYGTDISQWTIQNSSQQAAATSFAQTYLLPYFKTSKTCGTSNASDCIYDYYKLGNSGAIMETIEGANGYYTFNLVNGVLISINFWDNSSTILGNDRFIILIDVNAQAQPNVMGKDIFFVEPGGDFGGSDKNKLWPYGYSMSRDRTTYLTGGGSWPNLACNKTTGSGEFCFALILVDGWQMKDDYPW